MKGLSSLCLLFVMWPQILHADGLGGGGEYCQNEHFKAECPKGHVIQMTSANYGRMRLSRCVDRDYGYISCGGDVLQKADTFCSGRRKCEISVPNPKLDETKPCPNDLKSYLTVTYKCVPILDTPRQRCASSSFIRVTSPKGNIASVITEESGRGSAECPWMIEAKPGQRLNLTVYDFTNPSNYGNGLSVCHAMAIIREKSPQRSQTLCGNRERIHHAYTSLSNLVEIRVLRNVAGTDKKHFIIHYEVIGCVEPDLPPQYKINQSGNKATVSCEHTGQSWKLVCKGSTWSGDVGNCSVANAAGVFGRMGRGNSLVHGVSVVLIVAIALALGIVILVGGLCILRYKRKQPRPPLPDTHMYQASGKSNHPKGKPPGYHPHPPMPPRVEMSNYKDPLYNTTENEYAYISEVPPPSYTTPSNDLSERHMELYKANKCDYGTNAHGQTPKKSVKDGRKPIIPDNNGSMRYVDTQDMPLPDPPTYFELDPEAQAARSENRAKVGDKGRKSTAGDNRGSRHVNLPPPPPPVVPGDVHYNQSVADFPSSTYDHLVDRNGSNSNHKSV